MVAHEAGIIKFQNIFRQRMVYSRNLETKVHRCNEISVSIVKNVESNFLAKKISTNAYHLYTTKLIQIHKELRNSFESNRFVKRHICVTKVELKIRDLLTYITCYDLRTLLNWIMNGSEHSVVDNPKTTSFSEKLDFIENVFIPIRYEKNIDDIINVESPEDQVVIDASEEQTRITIYDFIEDVQYTIYGLYLKEMY